MPWQQTARDCVSHLRAASATDPDSEALASLVGELTLTSEVLHPAGDGLRLVVFQAAPGSPDADALALLSLTAAV